MRALRVLVLVHPDLVPADTLEGYEPKEFIRWISYFDVVQKLREAGHEVEVLGVQWELGRIRETVERFRPRVVFNLLEEFYGQGEFDQHVASYLELLQVPYTGCNPRGLVLSRSKELSKKLLSYHRIRSPAFFVVRRGRRTRRPRAVGFPLFVKSASEDASMGISQASIVNNDDKLADRVAFVHESVGTDALVEQFIPGRELYVGVLGNDRLRVLPVWELAFGKIADGGAAIATARVKHNPDYQEQVGIEHRPAEDLPEGMPERIARTTKRIYRILGLDGYARIDYRLTQEGELYFLEANANPDIGMDEEFACAAEADGLEYPALLEKILRLGIARAR